MEQLWCITQSLKNKIQTPHAVKMRPSFEINSLKHYTIMATINSNLFGSAQKDKLRALGCTDNTQIEILIHSGHYGNKMIRMNNKVYCI